MGQFTTRHHRATHWRVRNGPRKDSSGARGVHVGGSYSGVTIEVCQHAVWQTNKSSKTPHERACGDNKRRLLLPGAGGDSGYPFVDKSLALRLCVVLIRSFRCITLSRSLSFLAYVLAMKYPSRDRPTKYPIGRCSRNSETPSKKVNCFRSWLSA